MSDCIKWPGYLEPKGYGRVGRNTAAHRLAYCSAHGLSIEDIKGMVVRHKCDNPACVNPDHLELGTPADNIADMCSRERNARGESHGSVKLTEKQVCEIRKRYVPRCRINGTRALAREYGVSHVTVWSITQGKLWRHTS